MHRFWCDTEETTKSYTVTVLWIIQLNESVRDRKYYDHRGMWQDKNNLLLCSEPPHPRSDNVFLSINQLLEEKKITLLSHCIFFKWILNFSTFAGVYVWSMFNASLTVTRLHVETVALPCTLKVTPHVGINLKHVLPTDINTPFKNEIIS